VAPRDLDYPADPYAPPGSDVNAGVTEGFGEAALPAERGTRFLAALIDFVIVCVPSVPMMAMGAYIAWHMAAQFRQQPLRPEDLAILKPENMALLTTAMGVGFLVLLAVIVYQWVLISRSGQTIGKRATGIRIVRLDGTPVSFGTGVVLRNWVLKLIAAILSSPVLLPVLPYLGTALLIVDWLFVFREDRRCIHDHIAGTRVVRLPR
jgi:uncharacterized RDD family membrane protein YckC